jgi:hypothetical protein
MLKDLINEILVFLRSKTIDSLIPPILFVSLNSMFNLNIAIGFSIAFSLLILIYRYIRKEDLLYALIGFIMLSFASLLAVLTNNPNSYFLPDLLTNVVLVVVSIGLLIIKKPLAAYASHLTRAWPLEWYLRDDVRPAYTEVSLFWFVFFLFKTIAQVIIIFYSDLVILNLFIGLPFTILIISISYVYGLIRLKQLRGPSVHEFKQQLPKPWKSQTKGF